MSDGTYQILVAENDPSIRELVRTQLRFAGHDVQIGRTGTEAIERIRALTLNALILDLNMPELDGFGVLEWLLANPGENRLPVLILTARHDGDDVKRALRLGAKDYLAKPFTQSHLVSRVNRLLRAFGEKQHSHIVQIDSHQIVSSRQWPIRLRYYLASQLNGSSVSCYLWVVRMACEEEHVLAPPYPSESRQQADGKPCRIQCPAEPLISHTILCIERNVPTDIPTDANRTSRR